MSSAACTFYLTEHIQRELYGFEPDQPAAAALGDCIDFSEVFGVNTTFPNGYGKVRFDEKSWLAHRLMWCVKGRELPPKPWIIRHRCHNRRCVNIDHLEIGDHRSNHLDAVTAGRKQGAALSEHQVVAAYRLALFRMTQDQTSQLLQCSQPAISNTLRTVWKLETSDRRGQLTDEHRRRPKHRRPKYHPRRNLSLSLPGIEAAPKAKKVEIKALRPVLRPRIDRATAPTQGRLFE